MSKSFVVIEHSDGSVLGTRVFMGLKSIRRAKQHMMDLMVEYMNGDTETEGSSRPEYTVKDAKADIGNANDDGSYTWTDPDNQYDVVIMPTTVENEIR